MYRRQDPKLEFVAQFVDSLTVRPFFEDLRRMRRAPHVFQPLPRFEENEQLSETATAA
jgi:hypothetical protein